MTCYSRTPLYLFSVLGKSSRLQEPNAETDHPECSSTSGSANLLKDWSFDPKGSTHQARHQLIWRGHALLHHASKNDQMGRCVEHTKGRHMCPALAMEAYRECCHCSSHSSPLSEMSTRDEQRCVRAQGNCLFSNTSLVWR